MNHFSHKPASIKKHTVKSQCMTSSYNKSLFQNTKNLPKLKGGEGTHNVGASWETFMNSRNMEHPKKTCKHSYNPR